MNLKLMLAIALAGHVLCWYCDRLLICTPGGKFTFAVMKDNDQMRKVLGSMPERNPILSMVLGAVAIFLEFFGYLALCQWMKEYSSAWAIVMLIGTGLFCTAGTAHHVLCGAAEWLYVRQGCTEEAKQMAGDLFKKTSLTFALCYAGILAFSVGMLAPVVSGQTSLPIWAIAFNLLPLYLVLTPFHIPGAGNIAGAVMFAGLLFLL